MQFPGDSPFQNVFYSNPPFETGRNRVEVVLQAQDEGVDSELGWRDVKVLVEAVVGGIQPDPGGGNFGVIRPDAVIARDRSIIADNLSGGRTVVRRAGGEVNLSSVFERPSIDIFEHFPLDPAFWSATVTVPAGAGKRRLLVREFERFYSDNTVNQRVGFRTDQRRIIEERLVFADVVDPATLG
jgi:hypothetical protein